jgi:hypothetical protein
LADDVNLQVRPMISLPPNFKKLFRAVVDLNGEQAEVSHEFTSSYVKTSEKRLLPSRNLLHLRRFPEKTPPS